MNQVCLVNAQIFSRRNVRGRAVRSLSNKPGDYRRCALRPAGNLIPAKNALVRSISWQSLPYEEPPRPMNQPS